MLDAGSGELIDCTKNGNKVDSLMSQPVGYGTCVDRGFSSLNEPGGFKALQPVGENDRIGVPDTALDFREAQFFVPENVDNPKRHIVSKQLEHPGIAFVRDCRMVRHTRYCTRGPGIGQPDSVSPWAARTTPSWNERTGEYPETVRIVLDNPELFGSGE